NRINLFYQGGPGGARRRTGWWWPHWPVAQAGSLCYRPHHHPNEATTHRLRSARRVWSSARRVWSSARRGSPDPAETAAPGAGLPLFSLRLQELHFTPVEIGWVCATQALAGLFAPLFAGQVADRWWPAERCLAVCAAFAGTLLWLLSELTGPAAVFATSLA